jgi:hypothetical protein
LGDTIAYERQLKIFNEFDSYSEISPSGRGLHVIVKGQVPTGRRRNFVEVYSSQRYITMTGNVYKASPIYERQQLLDQLYAQMGGPPVNILPGANEPQTKSDEEVIAIAKSAENYIKFEALWNGDISIYNNDHSAADQALMDMIRFYTKNFDQAIRIFRMSTLGKRSKANRKDYIDRTLKKSCDRDVPPIDFEGFKIALEEKLATKEAPKPIAGYNPSAQSNIPLPPGLMGEIAKYIYDSSPLPVPEIAIAGAIGLMAGICGKSYNIPASGLNMYILLLAMTGSGKESMSSGINGLVSEVQKMVPVANEFIGPSEVASGQAIVKYMAKKSQCFVSIFGEFGLRLQAMSDPKSNSADKSLKRILLDLFNKSARGNVARSSIYADQEKNTADIQAPALTILGESTPETFYSALNEDMITDGLLTRFLIIEYHGNRPPLNKAHMGDKPTADLVDKVATLMAHSKKLMSLNNIQMVDIASDAEAMADEFEKVTRNKINSASKDVIRNLWNRAYIKSLKLAALVAIGENFINPVISAHNLSWSIKLVTDDIKALSGKFEEGVVGKPSIEVRQMSDVRKAIINYVVKPFDEMKTYKPDQRLHSAKIIPQQYISRRLLSSAAFKEGGTFGLKRAIQNLIDEGFISEVNRNELITKFGIGQRAFMIVNMAALNDFM